MEPLRDGLRDTCRGYITLDRSWGLRRRDADLVSLFHPALASSIEAAATVRSSRKPRESASYSIVAFVSSRARSSFLKAASARFSQS
jgi:hypothetical protein